MIFVAIWVVLGLIAQGLFMLIMHSKYPNTYLKNDDDWDILSAQLVIAMLAGPICFLAFAIIFGDDLED